MKKNSIHKQKTIVFGITSGIAAYKAAELVKSYEKRGYSTVVLLSKNAMRMLGKEYASMFRPARIATELFPKTFNFKKTIKNRSVEHIDIADAATLVCIVPATANTIAKAAHGIADNLLLTTLLATRAPVLYCPSMNVNMWNNVATQQNLATLRKRGAYILEPASGPLACGYNGLGRLPEVGAITTCIDGILNYSTQLKNRQFIVTAGGTQEPLDDVRVLSNRSSGKMAFALVEELSKQGASVTLIRARTDVPAPIVAEKVIDVGTALEMRSAILKEIKKADAIIHAAAVGDYRMASKVSGKIASKSNFLNLKLVRNPKIIEEIKQKKRNIFLVGFKAESKKSGKQLKQSALDLIKRSKADIVVANDVSSSKVFGLDSTQATLIFKDGKSVQLAFASKTEVAKQIIDAVAENLKM